MPQSRLILEKIYRCLYHHFGPQDWWPGDTAFEVMVGAILTQNTNWTNVEKAIGNLKKAGCLDPRGLQRISLPRLARLIKPSGYYNIKAKRLKNFITFFFKEYAGNVSRMTRVPWEMLRPQILSVNGIGEETADSILLYALGKPVFVVDAYTRRIFSRHGLFKADTCYGDVQKLFMERVKPEAPLYNEYHALIVRLGKEFCRPRPVCALCPLREFPHRVQC